MGRFLSALVLSAGLACTVAACGQRARDVGINLEAMDTTVQPGNDFYGYANGNWQRTTEIPADRASIGGFYIAFLETERQTTELVQGIVSSNPAAGTNEARIANFYNAYANTAAIDAAGMAPVQAELQRINAITTRADLSRVLGSTVRADVDAFNATDYNTSNLFGVFVTQALGAPEVMPYLMQGGLSLPEREYYLSNDPEMAEIRTAYRAYIEQLLTLAGVSDAAAKAQRIYNLEVAIARAHMTRAETGDFPSRGAVWTRAELEQRAPGIDWNAFLTAAQLGNQQRFAAYHDGSIPRLAALVGSQPIQAWKDWLTFHHINAYTDVLPTQLDAASFAFYGTTLSGTPQQRERAKRALDAVNGFLGDAVGQAYAQRYFPASARDEVRTMVENIKTAFAERIRGLDWMADTTQAEALRKVETLVVGVGYPDSWRDYSTLEVSADNAYANVVNAELLEYRHQLAKIGRPLDRAEWWMTPQTVNAVNLPVQNAMNFPAAILQAPFFNASADAAFNYGAIGAVIGHEVSHSFDDSGASFDSTGMLRNWWTEADLAAFRAQGDALARQYSAYEPFPGLHINGEITLGENIADVAGLQAAFDAYHASLGGREAPVIDGLTGDQRFFIAFAQAWASKTREEALRQQVMTDGHAPGQYRALTVRNLDGWYEAFNVQPNATLYLAPDARVRVW
ncbi:M13 family metallopeptidase [Terricaulis silvestris]|uniref:Neutral endopeptidase n=1 Tax=Terricaulis silvestris TaxID=2686094 RepID=A0A6I6MR97_9CAUL|nr:M13 family metallopeptidase [Terricaulis silvestris]QGZ95307.1 Neutral endopeptidase [Terricaulis silvestris]